MIHLRKSAQLGKLSSRSNTDFHVNIQFEKDIMSKYKTLVLVVLFTLIASGCSPFAQPGPAAGTGAGAQPEAEQSPATEAPAEAPTSQSKAEATDTSEEPAQDEGSAESSQEEGEPAAEPTPTPLVPLEDIISGGVAPDQIPPIDAPKFVDIDSADEWLEGREPVISVEVNDIAKAYPLQILTWHEIANDRFGDQPVTVTYCPLCNTALVFDREVNGTVYDFGTSGRLYNSALVMYDRQTESWWSQVMGQAIVGELTGTQLEFLPAAIVSWSDFKKTHPSGKVLSRNTGHQRPYGTNPYASYDAPGNRPFLFKGEVDTRLKAMERVVGVKINGEAKAYPFSVLAKERVVSDTVGGRDIVVFYYPGTASALDQSSIARSRDVGAAAVFAPVLEGEKLTFSVEDDGDIVDDKTGSTWNVLGEATSGPLEGEQLTSIVHGNHFWFAWAAFNPETDIVEAS